MTYNISQDAVRRIAATTVTELGNGMFNHGEVLCGLAEALGRVIVEAGKTPVEMQQMVVVVSDHLTNTIKAGANHKGFNI